MDAARDDTQWLRDAFRDALLRGGTDVLRLGADVEVQGLRERPTDPKKLAYLRDLIRCILEGRDIVATYNLVLLGVLFVLTVLHFRRNLHDAQRWEARKAAQRDAIDESAKSREDDSKYGRVAVTVSSSSSSILETTTSPQDTQKQSEVDLERMPLLGARNTHEAVHHKTGASLTRRFASWLAYQPPSLPLIHRTLPSNGTSLFILSWMSLNLFYTFYLLPLEWRYFFVFADRAGFVFIVNLPLLYLLAAKNQPIKLLTGLSYEALNIFHRRVGELMCFVAMVHLVGMFIWRVVLEPDWLAKGPFWEWLFHPLILWGFGALFAYELIYFTSLGSFRQRWYELFLASHIVLQVLALFFLWMHFWTCRPYINMSLLIFFVDRLVWRLGLKSTTVTADLTVLPDGETFIMSANWDIPTLMKRQVFSPPDWFKHSIRYGWRPTDHVFITVPVLGRSHALQAHPFTIASAAPGRYSDAHPDRHAWFSLLIRAHSGFTSDLLSYAHRHQSVSVRLDGPYGSSHALEMLRAADSAILVAGGSGIAVTFPLVWALLMDEENRGSQKVHLLWVIHSPEHLSWIPRERLDELVDAGLELIIPQPTALAGRPDVVGCVSGWVTESSTAQLQAAVVVSGPDGLNRMVRNTCAEAIGKGADVRMAVEKFGW